MTFAWSGPDPTPFTDPATGYELGTKLQANVAITVNSVRIWAGATSVALVGRKGRIWNSMGTQVGIATLPAQLTPGWNNYPLDVPVSISAGSAFTVSYSVQDTYGAVTAPGYPRTSADGAVTATVGTLKSIQGTFSNDPFAGFYAADIDYVSAVAGNVRPVVGIVATTAALTASATLSVTDEAPATVTYVVKWGDGASSAVTTLGPHAHTYAAPGTYAVMVTATDAGGLTDSAATAVTVAAAVAGPGTLAPNDELVAQAWLRTIPGIAAGMVSTNLPRDNSTWSASGFVQVAGVVGGAQDMDTGRQSPVFSLDLWGNTKESALPPWGKASRLGGLITDACIGNLADHVLLDLGSKYAPARVMAAIAQTKPRRIPGDKSGYAHYTMDLLLSWVAV